MFVVIAKNASTTLKRLVHSLDHPDAFQISDTEMIHNFFGFSLDGKIRIPLNDGDKRDVSSYVKFAIYRDPIERFLSVYYDKVSSLRSPGKPIRRYFSESGIINSDIDTFIGFTKRELGKNNILLQDEHLRKQSSFYVPSDVDYIVPLESLDLFLQERLEISSRQCSNQSRRSVSARITDSQKSTLNSLYEKDFELLNSPKVYRP